MNSTLSGKTNESPVRQSVGNSQVASSKDPVITSFQKTSLNELISLPNIATPNSDEYEPNRGASMTFTFNEGLVVSIKPNGDIEQIASYE